MKNDSPERIHSALQDLPDGTILVNACPGGGSPLPEEKWMNVQCTGKGTMDLFEVFPGITLSLHRFLADQIILSPVSDPDILEITHCRAGRILCDFGSGTSLSLGEGDFSLSAGSCRGDLVMTLPLGYFEGIHICIDPGSLPGNLPPVLQDPALNHELQKRLSDLTKNTAVIPAGPDTECIFRPLYDLPPDLRMPYFKLKVQELFLYFFRFPPDMSVRNSGPARQTALMRQIHRQITAHPEQRYTIEELSRQYLINTSSLKETFKKVYGMPIASYMKEYRIRKAMELLLQTDDSIAEISARVGYETQGKFTKAFKEFTHMTPSSYRKNYRTANQPFFHSD